MYMFEGVTEKWTDGGTRQCSQTVQNKCMEGPVDRQGRMTGRQHRKTDRKMGRRRDTILEDKTDQ